MSSMIRTIASSIYFIAVYTGLFGCYCARSVKTLLLSAKLVYLRFDFKLMIADSPILFNFSLNSGLTSDQMPIRWYSFIGNGNQITNTAPPVVAGVRSACDAKGPYLTIFFVLYLCYNAHWIRFGYGLLWLFVFLLIYCTVSSKIIRTLAIILVIFLLFYAPIFTILCFL